MRGAGSFVRFNCLRPVCTITTSGCVLAIGWGSTRGADVAASASLLYFYIALYLCSNYCYYFFINIICFLIKLTVATAKFGISVSLLIWLVLSLYLNKSSTHPTSQTRAKNKNEEATTDCKNFKLSSVWLKLSKCETCSLRYFLG